MNNRAFYASLARMVREDGEATLLTLLPEGENTGSKALLCMPTAMPQAVEAAAQEGSVPAPLCTGIMPQESALLPLWQQAAAALPQALPCVFPVGGRMVLAEKLTRRPQLVICGGGHISAPLAATGALLDFDVTVIDDREEFSNATRFPTARVLCMPFGQALSGISGGPNTYFVIITRGHSADRECMEHILRKPAAYVGMIGSRHKVEVVMAQLAADGFDRDRLQRVYAPIGLKIGAQTPAEIAVCIAAELVQVRRAGAAEGCLEEAMLALLESPPEGGMAMAAVVSKHGSAPRSTGARMLVLPNGTLCGSVGGGAGEAQACEQARLVLETGQPALVECDMTNEDAKQQGMVCGGKIAIWLERIC